MKFLLAILLACSLAVLLPGQPAGSNHVEMIWSAPTNDWPSSLWVYKVMPQSFSPAVISNLLAMASFKMADNLGTNGRWLNDWNDLNFETPDEKRHLWVCFTYGYIEYQDYLAEDTTEKLCVGVPTDEEAYPIGLDYLRKFGIDRSQLATKPSTNAFTGPIDLGLRRDLRSKGWTDRKTHKSVSDVVYRRGIYFVRRLDGINIDGIVHGGMYISFGEHAKICDLKITWRNLEPFELRKTATPAQIMDQIRQGRARWLPYAPIHPIKRITIFGYEPFYRGQAGDEALEKQQRFVEPYVMIYASLNDGGPDEVKCYSEMPIFPAK